MTTKTIGRSVRTITREALTRGKLDRAAVRRVTGEATKLVRTAAARSSARTRQDLARARNELLKTLHDASSAGVTSAAMAARIAAGMLAGIADALAQKPPRRPR